MQFVIVFTFVLPLWYASDEVRKEQATYTSAPFHNGNDHQDCHAKAQDVISDVFAMAKRLKFENVEASITCSRSTKIAI